MSNETPSMREVRYQWVEFMCTFAGLGKKRHYEDLFDAMLLAHNREVAGRLDTLVKEISDIHRVFDGGDSFTECVEDVENWPCRTIQAVRKAKA